MNVGTNELILDGLGRIAQLKMYPCGFIGDSIFGVFFGTVLWRYKDMIATFLLDFNREVNQVQLPILIRWLMGYPAGLKLNSYLSKFIGELYLWLLTTWNGNGFKSIHTYC